MPILNIEFEIQTVLVSFYVRLWRYSFFNFHLTSELRFIYMCIMFPSIIQNFCYWIILLLAGMAYRLPVISFGQITVIGYRLNLTDMPSLVVSLFWPDLYNLTLRHKYSIKTQNYLSLIVLELAWNEYHDLLSKAKEAFTGPGLIVDMHGHTHEDRTELG